MSNNIKVIIKKLLVYNTTNHSNQEGGYTLPLLKYVEKEIGSSDVEIQIQEYQVETVINGNKKKLTKRGNLIAYIKGCRKPKILLQGHVDTVPNESDFTPKVTNTTATGRGAVDMKGPVTGLISTFKELTEKPGELQYSPVLLLTSDEEAHNFAGIKHFLRNPPINLDTIKSGICGEPTNLKVKNKLYGAMYLILETHGKEGHPAMRNSENAIEKAIPILEKINRFKKYLDKKEISLFGISVLNIGVINGGIKVNVVPSCCQIQLSIRNAEPAAKVEQMLREALKDEDVEIKSIFTYDPYTVNGQIFKNEGTGNKLNISNEPAAFMTEATFLNQAGIPTVVYGPGNPNLAHADPKEEKILITDIERYSDSLKSFFLGN